MLALSFLQWLSPDTLLSNPLLWLFGVFDLWMLIDAVRREEWLWAVFIFIFPVINAVLYFFMVYRAAPSATRGFELPGSFDRRRIKQLEDQIHHLDKAHHHCQLGDIYFQQGRLAKAEACYKAALERDPEDLDTRAHYAQCLLREKRGAEALPLLEKVRSENPAHDYGYSLMALAECYADTGQSDRAIGVWQEVLQEHSYARARVQLAELYLAKGMKEEARREAEEMLSDDVHSPPFQRRKDKPWVRRAKVLLTRI